MAKRAFPGAGDGATIEITSEDEGDDAKTQVDSDSDEKSPEIKRAKPTPATQAAAAAATPSKMTPLSAHMAQYDSKTLPPEYDVIVPELSFTAEHGSHSEKLHGPEVMGPGGSLWRMRVFPGGAQRSGPMVGVFFAQSNVRMELGDFGVKNRPRFEFSSCCAGVLGLIMFRYHDLNTLIAIIVEKHGVPW